MKILVVDIETTGFLCNGGRIVELGAVSLDLETGEREIVYDKVFNPGMEREELEKSWIVSNGYMDTDTILDGIQFEDERNAVQEIVDAHDGVTAFNRNFDIPFLEVYGIKFAKLVPCPMLLATPICKLPGRRGGYKWPKAEEAYKHFFPESEYIEAHRGADDAMHEAEIIYAMHKNGQYLEA